MDTTLARKMWRTLEPYHGFIYFSPARVRARTARLGVTGQDGYFASRSAPMGAVTGEVVVATFFNFNPALVAPGVPGGVGGRAALRRWPRPASGAVDTALREALGDAVTARDIETAAVIARRAAEAAPRRVGRSTPATPSLAWPDEPHLALWHAITLLREFRGDGHIAALVDEGLDGCEALVTHGADGAVPPRSSSRPRGWSDERVGRRRPLAARTAAGSTATPRPRRRRGPPAHRGPHRRAGHGAVAGDRRRRRRRAASLVRPFSRAISESGIFLNRPN